MNVKLFLVVYIVTSVLTYKTLSRTQRMGGVEYFNYNGDIYKYNYSFRVNPNNHKRVRKLKEKSKKDMRLVSFHVLEELDGIGIARDRETMFEFPVKRVDGRWLVVERG